MGHRSSRVLRGFATALVALALASAPVAAAPAETFSFSRLGLSADASTHDCVANIDGTSTCSGVGIFLFAGKTRTGGEGASRGIELCAYNFSYTLVADTFETIDYSEEFGCTTELGAGSVIAKDLSTATLTPTTVTVQTQVCDDTGCTLTGDPRDIVVEGSWTGGGPVVRSSYRSFTDDGVCVFRDRSHGDYRDTSFSGTYDGQPLEGAYASLRNGSFSYSVRCTV